MGGCQAIVVHLLKCSEKFLVHCYAVARALLGGSWVFWVLAKWLLNGPSLFKSLSKYEQSQWHITTFLSMFI